MEQPLVTIGITTYNSNITYLSKALDSAINQDYPNIEIIVSDDFSNNVSEIENLIKVKEDKRIIFLKSSKNKGVSDSLNRIVSHSKGYYFTWCPDDDFMHLSKIKFQVKSLKSKVNTISICNHYQIFDFLNIKRKIKHSFFLNFFDPYLYLILLDRINGAALMIPTDAIKKEKFNTSLKHIQDYDMWIRLFDKLDFKFIEDVLFYSRVHAQQSSNQSRDEAKKEIGNFYLNYYKLNLHNLIYFNGVKIYLWIVFFSQYRELNSVVSYCMDKNSYKRYVLNFFNRSSIIYFIAKILKMIGSVMIGIRNIKNYFLYKIMFKLINYFL